MLTSADRPIEEVLPIFADLHIDVAFLSPTPTNLQKSILDAVAGVRTLLKDKGIHDYDTQLQGPQNKVLIPAHYVRSKEITDTKASLYRPVTKMGDPRIWFYGLQTYSMINNLLALVIYKKEIYVINLSDPAIEASINNRGFVYRFLKECSDAENAVSRELLHKIWAIHQQGFLPSITKGDPGVGDTLENALGIHRNNLQLPDYKGIELKATRITRYGAQRPTTRVNLFAKVPDSGMSYSEIVRNYGRWVYVQRKNENRLQIENTTFYSHPNSDNLQLGIDEGNQTLDLIHVDDQQKRKISHWELENLKKTLLIKHHETFWVQASSEYHQDKEWFRYDRIIHTKAPNFSLFQPMVESDKIMVDLLGYFTKEKNMKWRDHGMLFKIWPKDIPLLLGDQEVIDLEMLKNQGDMF